MRLSSDIIGTGLHATDGSIGSVADLLFDEDNWAVRWAVIDTGSWLPGRKVLLPPNRFGPVGEAGRELRVDLDQDQIRAAPGLETDEPVSRQLETSIYGHYELTPYWMAGYGYPIAAPVVPGAGAPGGPATPAGGEYGDLGVGEDEPEGDPRLRSASEVTGYYLEASDGSLGHVDDFLLEGDDWVVRYLVIDTRNWWPGKKVLISPTWLTEISWGERTVHVDVTRDKVKQSPEYDPMQGIDRRYEKRLHGHYGYAPYWPVSGI